MSFNEDSRTKNIVRTSFVSTACNIANLIMAFLYRSIFLWVLSSAYLGVNGLFTNILGILSLAELGVTSAIVYRFYGPISRNDARQVGRLMNFFKQVYRIIALVIIGLGAAVYPWITYLIKDPSEVPADIHLHVVYILFVLQSVSTYICAYRQTLLTADQKQYLLAMLNTGMTFASYLIQAVTLVVWKNYTLTLLCGIAVTVSINYLIGLRVKKMYPEVFLVKENLTREEKKEILSDTNATMLHKVGGTILSSTDNMVLSKFVGITVTGIFSNYSMILMGINRMVSQLFGSFTSSLGNAHVTLSKQENYKMYKKLLFLNFWVVGMLTVCIYNLIDDFIVLWVGRDMILGGITVTALCIQFYLEMVRYVTCSYITASGLFVKDRFRPLIEAAFNVVISIAAVKRIGIAGVFIGTIISHLLTVSWREPHILYKFEFGEKVRRYWLLFFEFFGITVLSGEIVRVLKGLLFGVQMNLFGWLATGVLGVAVYHLILALFFCRNVEFQYYIKSIRSKLAGMKKKRHSAQS